LPRPRTILVNARGSQSHIYIDAGRSQVGFDVIRQGLEARGLEGPRLFPPRLMAAFPPHFFDEGDLLSWLRPLVTPQGEGCLFGISTTTDDYAKFRGLSRLIAAAFPLALRVGGGPHFQREHLVGADGREVIDPVEAALREGLVHAAVCGHAAPLVELAGMLGQGKAALVHGGVRFEADPPAGLYFLADGEVAGKGRGAYPELSEVPLAVQEDGRANVLIDDTCSNRCDFCSVLRASPRIEAGLASATLARRAAHEELTHLNFVDSNPLEGKKFEKYEAILGGLPGRGQGLTKSLFIDPSLILEYGDRLLAFMADQRVTELFTGREVVAEDVAERAGVRFRGQLKRQARLDTERDGLDRLVKELKRLAPPADGPWSVLISYIVTPFETRETAEALVREMASFQAASNERVQVIAQFSFLCPYPGTKLRERQLAAIDEPGNYLNYSCMTNVWSYDLGRAVHLIDALKFHAKFQLYGPEVIHKSMLEQVARVFSGEAPGPLPLPEKRAFIHSPSFSMGGPFLHHYADHCRQSVEVPY
jgi:hypothetical protein